MSSDWWGRKKISRRPRRRFLWPQCNQLFIKMSLYSLWQSSFLVTSSSSFVPIDQYFFERPSAAPLLCLWPWSPILGFSKHAHQTRPLFAFRLEKFYYNTTFVTYSKWCHVTGWTHRLIKMLEAPQWNIAIYISIDYIVKLTFNYCSICYYELAWTTASFWAYEYGLLAPLF